MRALLYQEMLKASEVNCESRWRIARGEVPQPQVENQQESDAMFQTTILGPIWDMWSATDPERVHRLQDEGTLYQEMLKAEQAYFRARTELRKRGMDAEQADEQARHDCLLWE